MIVKKLGHEALFASLVFNLEAVLLAALCDISLESATHSTVVQKVLILEAVVIDHECLHICGKTTYSVCDTV